MAKDAKKTNQKSKAKSQDEEVIIDSASVDSEVEQATDDEQQATATAKAGKRSTKSLKEAEEKEAKEERKAHTKDEAAETEATPKKITKPTRSRLERRGKKFREVAKLIEKGKVYDLAKA